MIGTSDGEQFATPFEHSISASGMGPTASEKPAGALKTDLGTQVANNSDMPFIKGMKPGEWGTPADITQTAREHGDFDFQGAYRRSLGIARPDWTEEDKDKYMESVPQSSLNPSIQKVLSQPHIAEAIANPKIDRTHDVPYVAGASAKPDDFTTHVDQHIPTTATISGKTFDPAIPLNIHEQVEREVMNNLIKKGMTDEKAYEIAHHEYAEPAEDAWYKAQGIDVKDVNKWWDQQNKITEKEKSTDLKFPPNLYKKPYPHDEVEGIKHEHSNVSAEWATSTKVAMNDEHKFVPFDPMQPKYSNPGGHEHIYSPAVISRAGNVHMGDDHAHAYRNAWKDEGKQVYGEKDQGFVTSKGRFVDRYEGREIAHKAGQISKDVYDQTEVWGLTSESIDK